MLDTFENDNWCHSTNQREAPVYYTTECDDIVLLLADLLEGSASEEDYGVIARHISQCKRCFEVVGELLSQRIRMNVSYEELIRCLHQLREQARSNPDAGVAPNQIEVIDELANTDVSWRLEPTDS